MLSGFCCKCWVVNRILVMRYNRLNIFFIRMGSICKSQNQKDEEINEVDINKPPEKKEKTGNKGQDTITIPNANGGTTVSQKRNKEQEQEEEKPPVSENFKSDGNELKRGDKKKMAKIAAVGETEEILENVQKQEKQKSPFDYQLILNALGSHFLFNQIQAQDKEQIVEKMFYCTVNDAQYVFKQGDKGSSYFLIERGQCQIIINGDVKKTLKSGDAFGELALLYNAPRSASVKAMGDCAFWAIDRNTFRKAIEQISNRDYEENKKFIQNVKFFNFLTDDQKDAISNVLITLIYKKGELIVNEGDQANSFFIIKQGTVAAIKGEKELRKMLAGESFGEQALFQNSQRGATVKAVDEEVRCLALSREDLTRILGDKIQAIMYNNTIKWAIERNQILSKLTKIQVEKIIGNCKNIKYKEKDVIFAKGQPCDKLVIVLEGDILDASTSKLIAEKGQLFGENFLGADQNKLKFSNDLLMKQDGLLAEIDFKTFFEQIGGQLEQILKKNENSHEVKYMKKFEEQKKKDNSHMKIESMISIKKLGQGQFGNVYLVKNVDDSKFYALKCISKSQIIEQNLEKHLAQEKKVLETIEFPFLMQFQRSFKDHNYIYFLVEYIRGMELFDVIREIGLLNTYDSQFYIGSLLLCMEYLHTNNIIYRDIKPENIMVDDKGYMKLIDMGTAKFLKGKGGRTYTIIGTPHYMAPEILTGKGYSYSVDLWSIGICLYEFMCGGVPYAEDADDPYEIYEEIIKKPLNYPSFLKDKKAKKLMDQLLNKTPELRLGSSYAALKANQWLANFDWVSGGVQREWPLGQTDGPGVEAAVRASEEQDHHGEGDPEAGAAEQTRDEGDQRGANTDVQEGEGEGPELGQGLLRGIWREIIILCYLKYINQLSMDQQRFGIQRERESSSFSDSFHYIESQVPKLTAGQVDTIVKQFQLDNEARVYQTFYKDQGADLPLYVRCPKVSEEYAMWAGFCFECGHDHEQKYFKSVKGNSYVGLSKNYDLQVLDFQHFSRKLSEVLIREINGLIRLKEEEILEKMSSVEQTIDSVSQQSNGLEFYKRFMGKYSQQKILKSLCSNNKLYPWYGYCTHCKENPPHQFYISFGGSQQPEQLPSSIKLKVVQYSQLKLALVNELKEHIWSFLQWKQYLNITSAQNERLGILSKIGSLEKSNSHYVQENQLLHDRIEQLKVEKTKIQMDFEEEKHLTETFESNKADHVFKGNQDHNTFYDIEINCESILQLTAGEGWKIKLFSQEYENKLKVIHIYSYYLLNYYHIHLPYYLFIHSYHSQCNTIIVSFYGLYNKGKTFLASKLSGKSLPLGYSVSTVGLSALYPQDLENENAIVFLDTAGTETPIQYQRQDEIVNQHLRELQANFEELQDQKPHEKKRQIYEIKLKDRLLTEHMIQKFILSESNIIFIIVDQLTKEEQRLVQKIKNLYENAEIIIVHNLAKLVSLEDVQKYIKIDILESFEVKEQFRIFNEINLKGVCYVENRYDSQGTKLPDITHVVMAYDNSEAGKKYNQFCYHYLKNRILAVTKAKEFDLIKKLMDMIKQHLPEIIDLPAEKFTQLQLEFQNNKILTNLNSTSLKSISFDLLGDLKVFKGGLDPKYSIIITEKELVLEVELAGPFAPTERDLKQYEKKLIQCKETGYRMFEWHGFRKEGTDRMQYIVLRGIKKDLAIEGKGEILANVRERGEFRLIIPINPGICVLRDDSPLFVVINGVPQLRYILQNNDEIDDFF